MISCGLPTLQSGVGERVHQLNAQVKWRSADRGTLCRDPRSAQKSETAVLRLHTAPTGKKTESGGGGRFWREGGSEGARKAGN